VRDSLKKSADDSPAHGFDQYPKGSVVICNACARPIYKLDYSVPFGSGAGRMAKAFKPLTLADVDVLANRQDVDAGVRASLSQLTVEQRIDYVNKLQEREIKTGDPMLCPVCNDCFVQVLSIEHHEVLDKAYTIEMLTIPPSGAQTPLRGKHIGYNKDWVH
jgi:hypothetical protein